MTVACPHHPDIAGTVACPGCRKSYCERCTVEFDGWTLCGPCKDKAVHWSMEVTDYRKPQVAFVLAMSGVFMMCFGVILDIVAIVMAQKALSEIAARPGLPGRSLARWSLLIASLGLLLHIVAVVAVYAQ